MGREELKGDGRVKLMIQELKKHYKKESRVQMMSKGKAYYKIKRGVKSHGDYAQWYECKRRVIWRWDEGVTRGTGCL